MSAPRHKQSKQELEKEREEIDRRREAIRQDFERDREKRKSPNMEKIRLENKRIHEKAARQRLIYEQSKKK